MPSLVLYVLPQKLHLVQTSAVRWLSCCWASAVYTCAKETPGAANHIPRSCKHTLPWHCIDMYNRLDHLRKFFLWHHTLQNILGWWSERGHFLLWPLSCEMPFPCSMQSSNHQLRQMSCVYLPFCPSFPWPWRWDPDLCLWIPWISYLLTIYFKIFYIMHCAFSQQLCLCLAWCSALLSP